MTTKQQDIIFILKENTQEKTQKIWRIPKNKIPKSDGLLYMLSIQDKFSECSINIDNEECINLDPELITSNEMDKAIEYFNSNTIKLELMGLDEYNSLIVKLKLLLGSTLNIEFQKYDLPQQNNELPLDYNDNNNLFDDLFDDYDDNDNDYDYERKSSDEEEEICSYTKKSNNYYYDDKYESRYGN